MKSGLLICLMLTSLLFYSCKQDEPIRTRTYYMGFQNSAPRYELDLFLQSLNIWTQRADVAMITAEVPWDSLLSGITAKQYVLNNYKGLVDYYRSKDLKLWVYVDPENGLKREADAGALVSRGLSIAQPEMQALYKRFVFVMDSILHPEHLGLALETNLIRLAAPDSIYQGVKKAANEAAAEIRAVNVNVKLSISVQADVAWGRLGGIQQYIGVGQDFTDFPFMQEIGISSYPYFGFDNPSEIPIDYYSRLVTDHTMPLFITEGGWTSQNIDGPFGLIISSEEKQRQYISRQSELLDHARAMAVFQLAFTDIDVSSLPSHVEPSIQYFATLGLVDVNLQPKPALGEWDLLFSRPFAE